MGVNWLPAETDIRDQKMIPSPLFKALKNCRFLQPFPLRFFAARESTMVESPPFPAPLFPTFFPSVLKKKEKGGVREGKRGTKKEERKGRGGIETSDLIRFTSVEDEGKDGK